jgi:hypothetical protein
MKLWRPITVRTGLGYENDFIAVCLISYDNLKYKVTFRDFREANVSIKSVDSISVLWRPRGDPLC